MKKKITLSLVVEIDDDTLNYYQENPADAIECMIESDKINLKIEDTEEEIQENWTPNQ